MAIALTLLGSLLGHVPRAFEFVLLSDKTKLIVALLLVPVCSLVLRQGTPGLCDNTYGILSFISISINVSMSTLC